VTPALELKDLSCGYGGITVVRDLNLTVEPGELVVLLGPNGAGKTTTLLTISGLATRHAGDILLDGAPLAGVAPHRLARLGVAHVPEGRELFAGLTVAENLRMGWRGKGRPDLDEALRFTPKLKSMVHRRAGLLSGGEQQMLAVARAVLSKPRLLMVDEMSLGLAPLVVESLMQMMLDVTASTGCGVLLVEQHVELALESASRAYVLSHGSVLLHEKAETLRGNAELLRASYLGETGPGLGARISVPRSGL
jgi:branched-chain amino acid transport system ATP-binding protein